jgi:hypothetical protein
MNDGSVHTHRVDASLGSKEAPLSADQIRKKFILNASRFLTASAVEKVLEYLDFNRATDLSDLMQLLSKPGL